MSKRIVIAVTFIGVIAVLGPGTRAAQSPAGPWPFDEPAPAGITRGLNLLPTLNVLPGEIDPSSVGVTEQELAMSGSMSSSGSSHSSEPSHQECSHDRWCSHNGPCSHYNRILVVDDDFAQCPSAAFTSVQAAVDAAQPGDKIKVCPGTYTEQVLIPSGKNNIMLYSSAPWQAKIQYPLTESAPLVRSLVRVNGATNVTIRDFTITGPGAPGLGCPAINLYGVRVDNSGSAVIVGNHITQIREAPPALGGCQSGVAVLVGRNFEGQTGSALVVHNVIDRYQKGGVVVDGVYAGSSSRAEVAFNLIEGDDETLVIAQNGVQISRKAIGNVHHNIVTRNNYGNPLVAVAAGVLLYEVTPTSTGTAVRQNYTSLNDDGIDLFGSIGSEVSGNWSRANDLDGIYAYSDTSSNRIRFNRAEANDEHDCHDDSTGSATAGTANFWFKNIGATENKPGLCKSGGGH